MGRQRSRANRRLALPDRTTPPEREAPYIPKAGPGQHFVLRGTAVETFQNIGEHPLTAEFEAGLDRIASAEAAAERMKLPKDSLVLKKYRDLQISPELNAAGMTFRILFAQMHRSGMDSTQALMTAGGGGGGAGATPWTDRQAKAIRTIRDIERALKPRDYTIVRMLCGEGHSMAKAVLAAAPCHPSGTKYRVIEALEELSAAMDRLRIRRLV
jgi:hypothetical protein